MLAATFRPVPPARRRATAGFTLIEVLVAIIVLSFGLLGAVGLQAAALQANKEARYQSSAARLGRELNDMMRGNVGVSSATSASSNPYLISSTAPISTSADCLNTSCSSTTTIEIAKAQMNDWLARVNNELPGARVVVCFDSTPYNTDGTPKWACDASGNVIVAKLGWTHQSLNRNDTAASAVMLASDFPPNVLIPMAPSP